MNLPFLISFTFSSAISFADLPLRKPPSKPKSPGAPEPEKVLSHVASSTNPMPVVFRVLLQLTDRLFLSKSCALTEENLKINTETSLINRLERVDSRVSLSRETDVLGEEESDGGQHCDAAVLDLALL